MFKSKLRKRIERKIIELVNYDAQLERLRKNNLNISDLSIENERQIKLLKELL